MVYRRGVAQVKEQPNRNQGGELANVGRLDAVGKWLLFVGLENLKKFFDIGGNM